MATYKAPLREIGFVLEDVLNVGRLSELPPYAEAANRSHGSRGMRDGACLDQ